MRNCQIFTPDLIVDKMLDMLQYKDENVTKTIFEPAFGDGAFLTKIVDRIMQYAQKEHLPNKDISSLLDNVYGVEIDPSLYQHTIDRLNEQLAPYNVTYDWKHLVNGDSLTYIAPVQFDYTISNPPFVRIHSLSEKERNCVRQNYQFGTGNTDLYIIFFELCINKMKHDGKMCFISPNSFLKNSSQSKFRKYLSDNNLVDTIIDYGNIQVFDNVLTYSAITLIDFNKSQPETTFIKMNNLSSIFNKTLINLQSFGNQPWVISKYCVDNNKDHFQKLSDLCYVQYGVATNADSVYLVKSEDVDKFEPELLRPVIKGSTLDTSKYIVFPYYWDDITSRYYVISEHDMMCFYPKTYKHFLENKEHLLRRDMEKDCLWYQYARSQGIQNSRNEKLILKHILSPNSTSCDCVKCDAQYIVYSGMFIVPKTGVEIEDLQRELQDEGFYQFAFDSGKDMSGGYKSINTKIVKNYIIRAAD